MDLSIVLRAISIKYITRVIKSLRLKVNSLKATADYF